MGAALSCSRSSERPRRSPRDVAAKNNRYRRTSSLRRTYLRYGRRHSHGAEATIQRSSQHASRASMFHLATCGAATSSPPPTHAASSCTPIFSISPPSASPPADFISTCASTICRPFSCARIPSTWSCVATRGVKRRCSCRFASVVAPLAKSKKLRAFNSYARAGKMLA